MQLLQSLTTDFARPQVKATTRGEDVLQRQDEKLLHGDVGVVACVQRPISGLQRSPRSALCAIIVLAHDDGDY